MRLSFPFGAETAICTAVDKNGKSVDALLRADRGVEASRAFFRRAVTTQGLRWPQKANLDGNAARVALGTSMTIAKFALLNDADVIRLWSIAKADSFPATDR